MAETGKEVEIKLRVADLAAARRALKRLGARPVAPTRAGKPRGKSGGRCYEFNTLFDVPDGGLAKHGQMLRVRVETPEGRGATKSKATRTVLTFKGPSVSNSEASAALGRRYKVREEYEVEVAGAEALRQILEGLGLRPWFHYEKYRTTFQLSGKHRWAAGLKIDLDETPMGAFLELEGSPESIDRAAELLGYHHGNYITKSYLALYLEQCRRRGQTAGDMLFPKAGGAVGREKNAAARHSLLDKASDTL
jgi:adenylate cyclase class 2